MQPNTLRQKLWMSATGLFLCVFLVIHLLGNVQLLLPAAAAREQFNWYSRLLSGNIVVKLIAYVLYFSIIAHAVFALLLTLHSRKANGTRYVYDKRGAASKWYTRNMGLLGTILLIFLVIHFKDFWYQYKFTELPVDAKGQPDLYTVVVYAFAQWWYVLLYVICMLALGFHLLHGFFSAARTLGLYHPKYVRWIKGIGWLYTLVITGGFIIIPLYVYFTNH